MPKRCHPVVQSRARAYLQRAHCSNRKGQRSRQSSDERSRYCEMRPTILRPDRPTKRRYPAMEEAGYGGRRGTQRSANRQTGKGQALSRSRGSRLWFAPEKKCCRGRRRAASRMCAWWQRKPEQGEERGVELAVAVDQCF